MDSEEINVYRDEHSMIPGGFRNTLVIKTKKGFPPPSHSDMIFIHQTMETALQCAMFLSEIVLNGEGDVLSLSLLDPKTEKMLHTVCLPDIWNELNVNKKGKYDGIDALLEAANKEHKERTERNKDGCSA